MIRTRNKTYVLIDLSIALTKTKNDPGLIAN